MGWIGHCRFSHKRWLARPGRAGRRAWGKYLAQARRATQGISRSARARPQPLV